MEISHDKSEFSHEQPKEMYIHNMETLKLRQRHPRDNRQVLFSEIFQIPAIQPHIREKSLVIFQYVGKERL